MWKKKKSIKLLNKPSLKSKLSPTTSSRGILSLRLFVANN